MLIVITFYILTNIAVITKLKYIFKLFLENLQKLILKKSELI